MYRTTTGGLGYYCGTPNLGRTAPQGRDVFAGLGAIARSLRGLGALPPQLASDPRVQSAPEDIQSGIGEMCAVVWFDLGQYLSGMTGAHSQDMSSNGPAGRAAVTNHFMQLTSPAMVTNGDAAGLNAAANATLQYFINLYGRTYAPPGQGLLNPQYTPGISSTDYMTACNAIFNGMNISGTPQRPGSMPIYGAGSEDIYPYNGSEFIPIINSYVKWGDGTPAGIQNVMCRHFTTLLNGGTLDFVNLAIGGDGYGNIMPASQVLNEYQAPGIQEPTPSWALPGGGYVGNPNTPYLDANVAAAQAQNQANLTPFQAGVSDAALQQAAAEAPPPFDPNYVLPAALQQANRQIVGADPASQAALQAAQAQANAAVIAAGQAYAKTPAGQAATLASGLLNPYLLLNPVFNPLGLKEPAGTATQVPTATTGQSYGTPQTQTYSDPTVSPVLQTYQPSTQSSLAMIPAGATSYATNVTYPQSAPQSSALQSNGSLAMIPAAGTQAATQATGAQAGGVQTSPASAGVIPSIASPLSAITDWITANPLIAAGIAAAGLFMFSQGGKR